MKKWMILGISCIISTNASTQNANGEIDVLEDMAQKQTIDVPMPDGVHLKTDIYLPILQDSLMLPFALSANDTVLVQAIPKGVQYIQYDTVNGAPAENPYQLPVMFLRTPYNKNTEVIGYLLSFLGYAAIIQDNRGAYASEGNYFPMLSDGWPKEVYHPDFSHSLDLFGLNHPSNSNFHNDGYQSILQINKHIDRIYQGDTFLVSNGSIGMIGASAMGNVQYQAAAAGPVNPGNNGLKALMPIVATNEHYRFTAVQNGVYRQSLVEGWIKRQYNNLVDNDSEKIDASLSNNMHTLHDFGVNTQAELVEKAIDYWMVDNPNDNVSGYYPNSPVRADLDASFAPVNQQGFSATAGKSRYTNLEVPMYHLTGWWDIFIDGQIETYNQVMQHLSDNFDNKNLQKLVIGPWAHQTVTENTTGDITYPDNVHNIIMDFLSIDADFTDLPINEIFNSEALQWFRYNLNSNGFKNIGEPKIVIPASTEWQTINPFLSAQIPSEDVAFTYHDFINYLAGFNNTLKVPFNALILDNELGGFLELPAMNEPLLDLAEPLQTSAITNFKEIPNVRFYVVGPVDDGVEKNQNTGNYWFSADTFPIKNGIEFQPLYFHASNLLDTSKPLQEGQLQYVHDPNNPVYTIGGANMIVETPAREQISQGQINLANVNYVDYTMNRSDVLQFTSPALGDSLSIIGFPKATIYAKSTPVEQYTDSTDIDLIVRIVDVYPDGRELFVTEGAVNARARGYAKSIAENSENPEIPFSNIVSGQLTEYTFQIMPIAYTFGANHKIKILISSSNYPRYQVNAAIPVESGKFYRRKPNDGKIFNYFDKEFTARKSLQEITFSNTHATKIDFPVYKGQISFEDSSKLQANGIDDGILMYPNPTRESVKVYSSIDYDMILFIDVAGNIIYSANFNNGNEINLSDFVQGVYYVQLLKNNVKSKPRKLVIQ